MKKKSELKLFQVRQYIMAKNAKHAMRLAKAKEIDDVWVDDEWKKGQHNQLASAIGFAIDE